MAWNELESWDAIWTAGEGVKTALKKTAGVGSGK